MDGPNVNLSFEEKLFDHLKGETGKHILKLGSCSLHSVLAAFLKGVLVLPLDFDSLIKNLYTFSLNIQVPGERITMARDERTYKCNSRICKKACRYKMVIYETCLCESA